MNSTLNDFSDKSIDLTSDIKLAKGYEAGHICGKFYPSNRIPDDSELINDLRNLVGVYRELVGIVGNNYQATVKDILFQDVEYEPRKIPLHPINLDLKNMVEPNLEKGPGTISIKKDGPIRNLKEIDLKETEEKEIQREKQLIIYLRNDEAQEKANGLHKKTLKILTEYLQNKGLNSKESVIDLLVEAQNKVLIFEVKSIHTNNFTYQTRSAIGQLLQYEYFEVKSEPTFKNMEIYKGIVYSKEPPKEYIKFLEACNLGVYWIKNNEFNGSEKSMTILKYFIH